MKFRIIATLLLLAVLAILAVGTSDGPTNNTPAAYPSSPDDGAMKGLKIE